jgi:hypothetical protein
MKDVYITFTVDELVENNLFNKACTILKINSDAMKEAMPNDVLDFTKEEYLELTEGLRDTDFDNA